jgi:hypothetical protein
MFSIVFLFVLSRKMILFKTINFEKMCTRYLTLCRKYVSYSVSWDFPEKNVYEFILINALRCCYLEKNYILLN